MMGSFMNKLTKFNFKTKKAREKKRKNCMKIRKLEIERKNDYRKYFHFKH